MYFPSKKQQQILQLQKELWIARNERLILSMELARVKKELAAIQALFT